MKIKQLIAAPEGFVNVYKNKNGGEDMKSKVIYFAIIEGIARDGTACDHIAAIDANGLTGLGGGGYDLPEEVRNYAGAEYTGDDAQ